MRRLLLLLLLCSCIGAAFASDATVSDLRKARFTSPKKWALVIGASAYESLGKLKYASKDAADFAALLKSDFQFPDDKVTLLTDTGGGSATPTAKNILASLEKLLGDKELDKGDLFIFYFSGHGFGTKKGDFLCPTDATKDDIEQVGLPVKEVTKRFVDAGLKNVLIITDACRAGEENPFGAELQTLGQKANLAVFLSTAPGKRSYELQRYGHGAFTFSLLTAMMDKSLYNPVTGSFWASSLAKKVEADVFALTQRDYGQYAQRPAAWNEKTSDILLASEVEGHLMEKAIDELAAMKGKPRPYGELVHAISQAAFETHMPTLAIELLKSLDSIGELTPRRMDLLATCLSMQGRDKEAANIYDRMIAEGNSYFRASAIFSTPSAKYGAGEKAAAAEAIWAEGGSFIEAIQAYEAAVSVAARARLTAKFKTYYGRESRIGLYWRGVEARGGGEADRAIELLKQCASLEGEEDAGHYALVQLLFIAVDRGDKALESYCLGKGVKLKSHIVFWRTQLAQKLKDDGDARLIPYVKGVLVTPEITSPSEIYSLVEIAGLKAGELLSVTTLLQKKFPYSWEAAGAKFLCEFAANPRASFKLPADIDKYLADPLDVRAQLFISIERMTDEGELSRPEKARLWNEFLNQLTPYFTKLPADPILWAHLLDWSLYTYRLLPLRMAADSQLFPLVFVGQTLPELTATALKIAMFTGDDAAAAKLWQAAQKDGIGKTDEAYRYATYLIVRGKTKEAQAMLATLPTPGREMGSNIKWIMTAYFDALAGKEGARKLLDDHQPDGVESTFLWILANDALGGHDRTERFFTSMMLADSEENPHFKAYLMKWLQNLGREQKSQTAVELAAQNVSKFGGNSLFRDILFAQDLKLADFAGTVTFSPSTMSEIAGPAPEGDLTLTITNDGKATGTWSNGSFTGKVDATGTLTGAGACGGKPFTVTAKLAPHRLYTKEGIFAELGQFIQLIGKDFAWTNLMLNPR